jgi:hypothetical protein
MVSDTVAERGSRGLEEYGLLFEYAVKVLLAASFLELVLYRLVSRLGMHLSRVAEKHESIRVTFKILSSTGFTLLNLTAILLFLSLFLVMLHSMRAGSQGRLEAPIVALAGLLMAVTVVFLLFPPAMLGSIIYNLLSLALILALVARYLVSQTWPRRTMALCYLGGVLGWLYYQTLSTAYGLMGIVASPPLVHEINRGGEALMVLASIVVFWAYGTTPVWSRNRRQRNRMIAFALGGGAVFLGLLFLDYFLTLYDPAVAESVRKAGEGIGWIFQMGMGYTFYLPFALYVTGLLCWGYTVIKLLTMGRPAGYGLGLMFLAGYALQLSHLTLMVVFGLVLLLLDARRAPVAWRQPVAPAAVHPSAVLTEQPSRVMS